MTRHWAVSAAGRVVVSFLVLTGMVTIRVAGSTTVTNADPAAVRQAVEAGGSVKLLFDGAVNLTAPLLIATDTTVEGAGREVALDGGNVTRHFVVTNGATLRLINLVLKNGRFVGAVGQTNQPGEPALGGSIYCSGGSLQLMNCTFQSNHVIGGKGGVDRNPSGPDSQHPIDDGGPPGGPGCGGAFYLADGRVSATSCLFLNNTCMGGEGATSDVGYTGAGGDAFGGAVFFTNSVIEIVRASFEANVAKAGEKSWGRAARGGGAAHGGALACFASTGMISNCTMVSNHAFGATRVAGSIGASADPFFSVNRSGHAEGGAVFQASSSLEFVATLFARNTAQGGPGANRTSWPVFAGAGLGGAIFNHSGRLEVRDSAFDSNQARGGNATVDAAYFGRSEGGLSAGGAIYNASLGILDLVNCTLAGNSADGGVVEPYIVASNGPAYGGAVFNAEGKLSLLNGTVAGNSVRVGSQWVAALGSSIGVTNGMVTLTNTILSCAATATNVWGTVQDGGHNIASDGSAEFTLPSSRNNLDPMLGPLADNGGPTPTTSLLPGSPAIDAGNDSACPPADQRGIVRPQGSASDIGAFELAPTLKLHRDGQGKARLDYRFLPNRQHRILASGDLIDWLELGQCESDPDGAFEFEDPDSAEADWRFYQVRPLVEN